MPPQQALPSAGGGKNIARKNRDTARVQKGEEPAPGSVREDTMAVVVVDELQRAQESFAVVLDAQIGRLLFLGLPKSDLAAFVEKLMHEALAKRR